MALLIPVQAAVGWIGADMARSPAKVDVMTLHKSLGVTLLLLAVARLCWRGLHAAPPAPADTRRWETAAARTVQVLLYLLLLALPLSGWLAASTTAVPWKLWWLLPWPRLAAPDQALHDWSAGVHVVLVWLLLALLALHVAAALRHHFLLRDDVLRGMWR
jgi:cytochrome b561